MSSAASGSKHSCGQGCDHDPKQHWRLPLAISDHLIDVCLLHWTWSPETAGIPDGFSLM